MSNDLPSGRGKHVPINYVPTPDHIAWAENMIRMVKDGATWGVPENQTIYIIDKTKKQLRLVEGEIDDWFYQNIILFSRIGYEVVDDRPHK
jgi:hypothetical protein